jgi:hypothetical protein
LECVGLTPLFKDPADNHPNCLHICAACQPYKNITPGGVRNMKRIIYAFAALMVGLAASANAATVTPEKVGTYVGTLTQKKYDYQLGTITSQKHTFYVYIYADDTFDLASEEGILGHGTGVFGYNNGFLYVNVLNQLVETVTLHFKNETAKGVFEQAFLTSPGNFVEGKFSIKKQ